MNREILDIEQRLVQMRQAFDESFASPQSESQSGEDVEFLRIIASGVHFAIRLADVSGLEADIPIVPLPATAPGLLGLGAVRGRLVAVFDLAAILGAAQAKAPHWMVLVGDRDGLGLAFDAFEGSCRVSASEVHPVESPSAPALLPHAIQKDGRMVHVIDVAVLISGIRKKMPLQ